MQKYIWVIAMGLLFTSCKKWLDVKPESQVSKDDLFNTESGFQEALNGVYSRGAQGDIYGSELSFGTTDVLSQNYSIPPKDNLAYLQTSLFNYKDPYFMARKDSIWKGLYHAIANCNLILGNVESHKSILSATNYAIVKAEALAMRGYLHFDALRLFAPSFASGPVAKAIPYVTDFSNKTTVLSTVTEVLSKILQDLGDAKVLLKPVDPILLPAYVAGYPGDKNDPETISGDLFLQNRRHRLNYYAVCGELARVNLYMDKKADALSNALEVINSGKFPWTKTEDFINADVQKVDRILYKELLFGWYIANKEPVLLYLFGQGGVSLYIDKNAGNSLYETGGVGAEDLRFKQWLKPVTENNSTRYELQKYIRDKDVNKHPLMAPALRLSEMYYIASECTFDSDPVKATAYVDSVRIHRGINTYLNVSSKDQLLGELLKEARKEFYGEGQVFYMYKRLNRGIVSQSGIAIPPSNNIFVWPLPNDELEYGNRN